MMDSRDCADCRYEELESNQYPCLYCISRSRIDGDFQYKTKFEPKEDAAPEPDMVNHPPHYCRDGAMECFDEFIMIYGVEAAKHACLFNLHKYRYRAADKDGEKDLKKSDWYMNKYKELMNRC